MGKKKTEEFDKAYDLFCNTELTQKEICKIVDVSPQQLSKWVKENNWDLDKTASQVTVNQLIREFYHNIALINKTAKDAKRPLDASETDQIIKLTNSITALKRKFNLSNYHGVLREFLEWEMKVDHEKAKSFAPEMFEFLKQKADELNAA